MPRPRTTRGRSRGCRRRRSATRGSPRCRPRHTPPTSTTCTTSPRATARTTSRTTTTTSSPMAADRPIGGATRLAGVIGWPVDHSRSPVMHNAAFAELGMDWAYVAMPVAPERLEPALRGVAALGFAGVNVTIPHKGAAARICDEVSDAAARAGSVNTVLVGGDGRLRGETTDGQGMLDAIGELRAGAALVLGAGGAARAAAAALRDGGVRVAVAARREQAAVELARELDLEAAPWPPVSPAALVINA